MKKFFLFVLSMNFCLFIIGQNTEAKLSPGFKIYLNDTNSTPINKALDILQRDILNVLAEQSPVQLLNDNEEIVNSIIILNNEIGGYNGINLEGFERHKLYTYNNNLILHGADELGTIFAMYYL
jgi:hypothetical protein